jgi:hypothetical protein
MNDGTKKKYDLYLEIVEERSWMWMPLYDGITIDVDFSDDEVETIRQLVSNAGAGEEDNLMPIIEDAAPEVFQRIDKAARSAMFDYYLVQADQDYNIEFDEDEQRRNFEHDLESGLFVPEDFVEESDNYSEVPEDDEELFDLWSEWEHNKFEEEDAEWIRSRYTIDENAIDVSEDEYICYIPEEWMTKESSCLQASGAEADS